MMAKYTCILCRTDFDRAPREHVLQASLGARWTSNTLICENCQTTTGSGIDVALADRLQPIRLLLGTQGDHGSGGRPLKRLSVSSGETVDLESGGKPRLSEPVVKVIKEGDNHRIHMRVSHIKDIGWALHKLRGHLPNHSVKEEDIKNRGVASQGRLDGEIHIPIALGGLDFFRAVAKSAVNVLAAQDPLLRDAFMRTEFDPVRAFVRSGCGEMGSFVRWTVSPEPLRLPQRGASDHAVVLHSREGVVEGVVQYFGHLVFAVRLAEGYSGPPVKCCYIVDPYREADPAEQRLTDVNLDGQQLSIPHFELQSPINNHEVQAAQRAAINRILATLVHRHNEHVIQQATDEARRIDSRLQSLPRASVEQLIRQEVTRRLG